MSKTLWALIFLCSSLSAFGQIAIVPDAKFDPPFGPVEPHLKAGALFTDAKGQKVDVDIVWFEVHIPFTKNDDPAPSSKGPFNKDKLTYIDESGQIYCVSIWKESNKSHAFWDGYWHEAWQAGYYWYDVIVQTDNHEVRKRFFVTTPTFQAKVEPIYEFLKTKGAIEEIVVK